VFLFTAKEESLVIKRKRNFFILYMIIVSLLLVSCQKRTAEKKVKREESIETKQAEDKISTLFITGANTGP